jgi:alpha-glucoside transport system substrate-binding protein
MKKAFRTTLCFTGIAGLLVLAACQPTPTPVPTAVPPTEAPTAEVLPTEAPPTEAPTAEVGGSLIDNNDFLKRAYAGEFKGKVVSMTGPFVDEDAIKFNNAVAAFESKTGIDIQYEGSKEFEASIKIRVEGDNAPDIVDFPQPGLLAGFVKDGYVQDVSTFISEEQLASNYNQSWIDMSRMPSKDGKDIVSGVWHRAGNKSLVFYNKAAFDAAGYQVPTTWDDMVALTQQIADDGDTAWCIGIESGAATGWVVTDWIEEIMLRTTSLENYDKWVKGELKFDSPEVKAAAEKMGEIWFNDDYVYGGRKSIVTTFIGDSPVGMFTNPPSCWFHKQASWITGFFGNDKLVAGKDYDFFYLPPIDSAYGKPVEVGGDIMSAFSDRDEVKAVMAFFATGASVEDWIKAGGAISPHMDSNLDWYTNDVDRKVAQIMMEATSLRFDASDLMPGAVGAGSFWTEMTDYVSGATDLDTALKNIDASWPSSTGENSSGGSLIDNNDFLKRAYAGEFKGKVVSMTGPFVDEDAIKFNNAVAAFESKTGIDIQYEGSKEFEASIKIRIEGDNAPDIVDFPQPGLLAGFVKDGYVQDVSTFISEEQLASNYNQSWIDMSRMPSKDGKDILSGVWHRAGNKSLVFYNKAAFDAAGYQVPTTWDDMVALTQQIADDGDTAWCIGIESGAATGWVVTDWIEEIMLRTTSLENYDKWVKGELKFDSPEVKAAAEKMGEIWFNDDYVYGGRKSIVTTFIGDSPVGMFTNPPSCWFHKQASWITGFFGNDKLVAGKDYDFFYLPPIDSAYGKPVEVGGDIMSAFSDRDEVKAVMAFFATGASVEDWIKAGGAISPHMDSNLDWYTNDVDRKVAQIMMEATSLRFDASDLMPGAVGAGSFWTEMTDYVSGATDLDTALKNIDASWPK